MPLISAKVVTDFDGKQPLLLPVVAGFARIVTRVTARNPTASLASFDGEPDTEMGFNALASNWWSDGGNDRFHDLTDAESAIIRTGGGESEQFAIGQEGEVFGIRFRFNGVSAELWIDVEYRDYQV